MICHIQEHLVTVAEEVKNLGECLTNQKLGVKRYNSCTVLEFACLGQPAVVVHHPVFIGI